MKVNLIENSIVINPATGLELKLGDKSIKQGSSFTITYLYEGNYTTWLPKGQIRNDYLGKGGTLLGEFDFPPLTYNTLEQKTVIVCNLKASVTKLLPPTVYQGGNNLSNKTAYVYEIVLINPTDSDHVLNIVEPSFMQVKPGVIK